MPDYQDDTHWFHRFRGISQKLTELHEHGHEVTALVRDDAQAERTPQ